jgi:hypothetical protein
VVLRQRHVEVALVVAAAGPEASVSPRPRLASQTTADRFVNAPKVKVDLAAVVENVNLALVRDIAGNIRVSPSVSARCLPGVELAPLRAPKGRGDAPCSVGAIVPASMFM